MASTHKSLRSGTANKRPTTSIADGQIALNTNTTSPGLFFKDSTGATIIKVGPVHVGTTAPNASPAAGGSAGNSVGEIWLDTSLTPVGVKIWNGSAFVNATPIGSTTVQGLLELATNAETQTGTDPDRAVTPAGLQSKVSDSTSTTSSTTIASSTAVKSAYDLANAALPKSGGTVTGNLEIGTTGSLSFEGATADAFETTIAVVDPTADRTITLPDTTGTVVTTGDTGTVTSTMIADGTIVNGDINASAAINHSKLANITAGSVLLGNASNVPTATALSGDVTVNSTGVTAISSGVIVNADVNASAAIAGTKISPDFGSQTITTTGVVSAALGAAATPSLTFTGDLNTGIYSPGADQVAISTGGSGRLFVNASGTIGIGATPITSYPLNIINNGNNFIQFAKTGDALVGSLIGRPSGTAELRVQNSENEPIAFLTNNTERLRITAAGLVGVGTSSPAAQLDCRGDARFGALSRFAITESGGDPTIGGTSGSNFLGFTVNGTTKATLTSTGLGIGTTSPQQLLHVDSGSGGANAAITLRATGYSGNQFNFYAQVTPEVISVIESTERAIAFKANGSERARIDSSGRLLVGTSSSPSAGQGANSRLVVQGYVGDATDIGIMSLQRGEGAATMTAGEGIGRIAFNDNAGNSFAYVEAFADASGGSNDFPGRLSFSTTADGASSPTERARITQQGFFKATNTNDYYGSTATYHESRTNAVGNVTHLFSHAGTSGNSYGIQISYAQNRGTQAGDQYIYCNDIAALRMEVRGNGGIANYQANNVNLSDRNVKKDITPASGTWNCIKEWEIVNYRYKDQPDDADLNLGVIAQQVAESCPEVITVFQEAKEATEDQPAQEERLGVKEQQMYWMAIKALQEAQARIEALEAEVAALKAQ